MEEAHPSSNVHTSSSVLLLLLAASLVFTSFVFPSSLDLTSKVFLVAGKKRWDFLILALVLFAIACGFLSRSDHVGDGCSSALYRSCDHGRDYRSASGSFEQEIGSGSCSDLREQVDGLWRFHDHADQDSGQGFGSRPVYSMRTRKEDGDDEELFQDKHVVADDTCGRGAAAEDTEVLVPLPSSALPGGPAAPIERKGRRTYHTSVHNPKDGVDKLPAAPQVPPLLPPSHFFHSVEEKSEKQRGGLATGESSSSLEKKKYFKSSMASQPQPQAASPHKKNTHAPSAMTPYYEFSAHSDDLSPLIPVPPLPLLPSPSPLFHPLEEKSRKERSGLVTRESSTSLKMMKKKRKQERINNLESFTTSLPLPPPPPALHKKKSHTLSSKTSYSESSDDSSSLSPMILTPPPPPPFDVPPWRFARRGHHVWIKSPDAWRHKSPVAEVYEDSMSEMTKSPSYPSSEATSPVSCRSPDVNKRAGEFIAMFRVSLNKEKRNSMKQRESNLGPKIIG